MIRNILLKSLNMLEKNSMIGKSPRFSRGLSACLASPTVASAAKTTLKIERVAAFCVVTQGFANDSATGSPPARKRFGLYDFAKVLDISDQGAAMQSCIHPLRPIELVPSGPDLTVSCPTG
jgi:hypothetical protein